MILSEKTRIAVGVGAGFGIVFALVTGTWTLAGIYNRFRLLEDDAYGLSRACEVALREAIENPGHRVPDPRDPKQIIVVNAAEVSGGPRSMADPVYTGGAWR